MPTASAIEPVASAAELEQLEALLPQIYVDERVGFMVDLVLRDP